MTAAPDALKFDDRGLVPVVVQDAGSGLVLMLAYANEEAVRRTIDSGTTWFWSRSRGEYWNKGASSGNVQKVIDVRFDCDGDSLLYLVDPAGPACHTGETSCFFRSLVSDSEG
jgi:phosphoribosyl-AMP cyclohydrolase